MPIPKISFKKTVLDLELENVEITVGPEIMRVGHLKASLDVADLLRIQIPELVKGDAMGVRLVDYGQKVIQCIKDVRQMTGWSLKDSKAFVESAPVLLKATDLLFPELGLGDENLVKKTEKAATTLELAGATVEIAYGNERIPTVLDRFREMLVEALSREAKVS